MNDRHQDDEMQDYEPGGPELTHNSDNTAIEYEYGDLEECLIQSFEARMAHAKISSDLITSFCKRLDALINQTLDECEGNQAVSRVVDDLKAYVKSSIVTHLSFSAQAADFPRLSPDRSQGNRPTASQALREQERTLAAKEPSQSLRRNAKQKATHSPPEKDIKHATPQSYAELLRGATPENLPKRPAQPLPSKRLSKTNRVFVRLPEDSALRSVHPLYIIKMVNSALPSGKEVETVSSVRTGVALTPKTGTTTDDLLQCKEKIAKALGDGRVEADEKWVIL